MNTDNAVLPATVSDEARAFLEIAVPADMSQPETVEDWQSLRTEMARIYDSSAVVHQRYPFKTTERQIGGVECLVFEPIKAVKPVADRVLVHLHGGAYVVGSAQIDSAIIAPLAHMTGLKVIAVNFRLAPEHPFPAALEDVLSVYKALLNEYEATDIAVTGSSSGASLALALAHRARTEKACPCPPVSDYSRPGLSLQKSVTVTTPWKALSRFWITKKPCKKQLKLTWLTLI